jgi:murein DD-endopeptidase MepM/ murein hydrolase activator NlpD
MADEDLFQPLGGALHPRGVPGDARKYRPGGPHKGIDYLTPVDTPVFSIGKGKVAIIDDQWKVGDGHQRGNWVVIDHGNGFWSSYQHLSKVLVKVGDPVYGGTPIAKTGVSGGARANPETGATAAIMDPPHLHFAMMTRNNPEHELIADPAATLEWAKRLVLDPDLKGATKIPPQVAGPASQNFLGRILDFFGVPKSGPDPFQATPLPRPPRIDEDPLKDLTAEERAAFERSRERTRRWGTQTPDGGVSVEPTDHFPRLAKPLFRRPVPAFPIIRRDPFPKTTFKPITPIKPFKPIIPPVIKTYTPPPHIFKPPQTTIPKPYINPAPYKPVQLPPMPKPTQAPFIYRPATQPFQYPISRPPQYRYTFNNLDGIPKPGTPATNFRGTEIIRTRI